MSSMNALIAKADLLQDEGKVSQLCSLLDGAMKEHGSSPEILWRFARACYLQGEEKDDKEWKQEHFDKGLTHAKRCLELEPKNGQGNKWMGILLANMGAFFPTKQKIANSFIIRDAFKLALEADPTDPSVFHCLGKWCFNVANISRVERMAASVIFTRPPEATFEEAEANFLKAAELNPAFLDNAYALGDLYTEMKRKADARTWYAKCTALPATTNRQRRLQLDAQQKANRL